MATGKIDKSKANEGISENYNPKAPHFVLMHDKFMSGWGMAKNGASLLEISCDSAKQANAIKLAAENRSEMSNVKSRRAPWRVAHWDHITRRGFADMKNSWREFYDGE